MYRLYTIQMPNSRSIKHNGQLCYSSYNIFALGIKELNNFFGCKAILPLVLALFAHLRIYRVEILFPGLFVEPIHIYQSSLTFVLLNYSPVRSNSFL